MHSLKQTFYRIDGPTWLVALALYGAWYLLVWFNALLPWWIILPVGAYLIAWHFSLQHEAIHSFRGVPAWLRFAIVFPPLGLCTMPPAASTITLRKCPTARTSRIPRLRKWML